MMIFLVELSGMRPDGTLAVNYFASGAGFVSASDDTPANQVYEARIVSPGTYERHLWQPGRTQGTGVVTVGSIELANSDGALDGWLAWDFDGRTVRLLRGDDAAPRASFVTLLTGTTQSLSMSLTSVQINLRDAMAVAAQIPLVTAKYGGTNVLPNGVDGTPTDIKGSYRPWLLGEVENFAPPRVNASLLIYELSQFPIAQVVGIYDGGNAITAGVARANVAALQATAPAAGQFDYTLGGAGEGAYVRLGSSPSLQVTAYARETVNAGLNTIAQIAARVLAAVGVPAGAMSALAAFDNVQPAAVGWWVDTSGATAGDVLDALCISGGATWTVARDGTWQIMRLVEPAAAPVAAFDATHVIDTGGTPLAITPTSNTAGGVPVYEVDLSYQRNYAPMSGSSVAGVVTAARKDWLALDYRKITARNLAIWNPDTLAGRNPMSVPLAIVTQLRVQSDAQAEADRVLTLYSRRRVYVAFSVSSPLAAAVDLGRVITLTLPRFGADAGLPFLVTGMIEDHASGLTELFCWR